MRDDAAADATLLAELRRRVERVDVSLEGLILVGPTQSVPAWEEAVVAADRCSRRAWAAYADALFG